MAKSSDPVGGPLEGIRVLELSSMYAAPTAGRMFRDFGADVIKVEDPVTGDFARQWTPMKDGLSVGFARLNVGKRSVGIDLRTQQGRELIIDMMPDVDVVVESFRPGRLEAWGLDYETLSANNPSLILTRVSGFGQTGPYKSRPGFGTVAETSSGYAYINGWPDTPPTSPPFGLADSIAGITAAMGTAMALFNRSRTGRGEVVDVALYEPLMFILGDIVMRYTASGEITERMGNGTGSASPRGIFQSRDGKWLSIAASAQSIAIRLFEAMERPDIIGDPRFATNSARMEHNDEMQNIVRDWVASMDRDRVLDILDKFDVVSAPVNDARDISQDPHFLERTLVEVTGSERLKGVLMPGAVLHLRDYRRTSFDEVPEIGEHTFSVLGEDFGISTDRLAVLADAGIISKHA